MEGMDILGELAESIVVVAGHQFYGMDKFSIESIFSTIIGFYIQLHRMNLNVRRNKCLARAFNDKWITYIRLWWYAVELENG